MLYISDCWHELADPARAFAAVDVAQAGPGQTGRGRDLVCAVQRSILELRLGCKSRDEIAKVAHDLTARLRRQEPDDWASVRLHQPQAYLHFTAERCAKAGLEFGLALERARALGGSYAQGRLLVAICGLAGGGPTRGAAGLRLG